MKDFMTIAGHKVRVEINWRAIADFCKQRGTSTVAFLSNLSNITPEDLSLLLVCAVHEGERLEGRESSVTLEDVNALGLSDMGEFIKIYVRQSTPELPAEQGKKA